MRKQPTESIRASKFRQHNMQVLQLWSKITGSFLETDSYTAGFFGT